MVHAEAARLAALHDGSIAAEQREALGTTSALALRTWSSARLGSQLILDREGLGAAWPSGLRDPAAALAPLPAGFIESA